MDLETRLFFVFFCFLFLLGPRSPRGPPRRKCGISDNKLGHALWIGCVGTFFFSFYFHPTEIRDSSDMSLVIAHELTLASKGRRGGAEIARFSLAKNEWKRYRFKQAGPTCFVSPVRLCRKQFHKDHLFYFPGLPCC